jgi:hypothetical protein
MAKRKTTGLEPNVTKVKRGPLKLVGIRAGSRPKKGYEPIPVRPDDIARQARKQT